MAEVDLLPANKSAPVCDGKLSSYSRFGNSSGTIGGAIEIRHFTDRTRLDETKRYKERHNNNWMEFINNDT